MGMYVDYFKLSRLPFSLNPDPRFAYSSPEHARVLARMRYAAAQPGGCLVVTGSPGVGKTLLLQSLFDAHQADVLSAQINQPLETLEEVLQAVLIQIGDVPPAGHAQPLRAFSDFLAQQYAQGRKVLLIVDEGHKFKADVLEAVLQLAGRNAPYAGDLRIVLAGESALATQLTVSMGGQRPSRYDHTALHALSHSDVLPYIEHRLAVAGADGRAIFDPAVVDAVFTHTGGVPRRINMLCDAALTIACTRNAGSVTLLEMRQAMTDVRWPLEPVAPPPPQWRETEVLVPGPQAAPVATTGADSRIEKSPLVAPAARPKAPGRLYVDYQGKPVAELQLTNGRASIGRAPDNELQIVSEFVSRHHCHVLTTAKGSLIEDVSSTNGVYMKNKRIRRHWLRDGDVLTIGDHELRYAEP